MIIVVRDVVFTNLILSTSFGAIDVVHNLVVAVVEDSNAMVILVCEHLVGGGVVVVVVVAHILCWFSYECRDAAIKIRPRLA